MALLQAYFDESQRESGLLCVAGYVFAPQHARKLTKEFAKAFGPFGGFHMKDLVAKKRSFKDISDADRERLIKNAVSMVKAHFRYGVAVTINIAEYEAQAPRWIRGLKNPYAVLCHLAMFATAGIAKKHGDVGPIIYNYEAGHPHQVEANFAVGQIVQTEELKNSLLYGGHSFLYKKDAVLLQSADLLAWESAKFKDETVDGQRPLRLSLRTLFAEDPTKYSFSDCRGTNLTRFLQKLARLGLEQVQEEAEWRETKRSRSRSQILADG